MYTTDNAEDLSRLPHYLPLESYFAIFRETFRRCIEMTSILSTIIVGLAVLGLAALAVRTIRKDRREGKSCAGCGGSCGGCSACGDSLYSELNSLHLKK